MRLEMQHMQNNHSRYSDVYYCTVNGKFEAGHTRDCVPVPVFTTNLVDAMYPPFTPANTSTSVLNSPSQTSSPNLLTICLAWRYLSYHRCIYVPFRSPAYSNYYRLPAYFPILHLMLL